MADLPEYAGIAGLNVGVKSIFGSFPIHVAAIWGEVEAGTLLFSAGADLNARGEDGYTPLHEAVEQDLVSFVAWLIAKRAALEIKNDDGQTPMDLARISPPPTAIEKILQAALSARV
jgi:uncharacterized protein